MKGEFIKGQDVEVTSKEPGFEDSWYVATLIRRLKSNKFLVEYQGFVDESTLKPLRETVDIVRLRPLPPKQTNTRSFNLNQEVDAFLNDGWWKGVIIKILIVGSKYTVFFKPTKEELDFDQSELRSHLEWVKGKWIISQNKEMVVTSHKEGNSRSPNPTDTSALKIEMATQRIPTGVSDLARDNALSSSKKLGGRMDDQIKNDFPSDAVIPNEEVLSSFKKVMKKKATKMPTCIRACNSRGISIQSPADAQYVISLPTTKGRRPEHEAVNRKMTVRTGFEQLLSHTAEEQHCLSLGASHGNQQTENGAVTLVNESMNSLGLLEPSDLVESLFLKENITEQYHFDNASRQDMAMHDNDNVVETLTNGLSSSMQHEDMCLSLQNGSLPFVKSSHLWETIESMEVFQLLPQQPHFHPLDQFNVELREGLAVGSMVSFASLVERTCRANLDEPRSMFEDKLNALADLEELGFTVHPICTRLEELLRIKDRYSQLDGRSKTGEMEVSEGKRKIEELQESITHLRVKIRKLIMKKEMKCSNVAELQREVDSIKGSIQGARLDFDNMVTSPLVGTNRD